MQHALDVVLAIATRHPTGALAFIALIAFAESLAVVGTLVPAAVVMFAAGVLVGHGTLELPVTLALAVAGAVAGDAVSFELGRRAEGRVRRWPLFVRHAEQVRRGEQLIARRGALSVAMARFAGAVRAFVPVLAGFAGLSRGKFYATNVASALLWAPAHILPGVVFGASLHLAEQASGRLAVLLLLLALLVWGATWLARLTIRVVIPLMRMLRQRMLLAAGARMAWWARVTRLLLDPQRPGSQALLTGLVVVLGSMWLFLSIAEDVVSSDPLVIVDHSVFTFLQQLRTAPVDRVMVRITEMGSVGVMLPLIVAVAAWLAVERCWRTAGYWVATAASAELMVQVLKHTLGRHRPLAMYAGVEQYSFPSGHATISAVVLAYLAFLLTRSQSFRWRVGVGATLSVYVALVGFSRLYLGAHWLSDVIAGFSFGLAAAALASTIYSEHEVHEPIRPKAMAGVAAATIVVAAIVWGALRSAADMKLYAAMSTPTSITSQAWIEGGFRQLPLRRQEIGGELREALTLQVACTEAAISEGMRRAGWQPAPGVTVASVLQAISPHPDVTGLPVLPKYDGGRPSTLRLMQAPSPNAGTRNVLRLWKSGWELAGGLPIWYGAFYREVQLRPNYSFVRQEPVPATEFRSVLESSGLHEIEGHSPKVPEAPTLSICGGS